MKNDAVFQPLFFLKPVILCILCAQDFFGKTNQQTK